ncbi:High mobility group protein HMG-I/HMG-Y, partial [Galemys pyrenaicus]
SAFATSGSGGGGARPVLSAQHRRSRQLGARTAGRRPSSRKVKMSESSSKSSQPLASKQEKDGTEKRGRGRPRKQPPVSPGTALVGSQEKEEEEGISQESSEEEQ